MLRWPNELRNVFETTHRFRGRAQLHWCLDVTFGQDANRTRTNNAAENLAVIRHFALNIIRGYRGDRLSVPRRRRLCDYRLDYREQLLGLR